MNLPRLLQFSKRRRANGILKVAEMLDQPAFSYQRYQEAARMLKVQVPPAINHELWKVDDVAWEQMTQESKLFIWHSSMSLLEGHA